MDIGFIIWLVLAIVGAALIAGGIVLVFRGNKTGTRAWGAAAIAAGVVMWAIILLTVITSSTTG